MRQQEKSMGGSRIFLTVVFEKEKVLHDSIGNL